MTVADPTRALLEAAQSVVDEHGWPQVTRSLAHAARAASNGKAPHANGSALAPLFDVIGHIPQSAWTPMLAPLVAAGLTSINQPQIDKRARRMTRRSARWRSRTATSRSGR